MLFERIFKVLNESGVQYVVIGGIAVNLHGFARATGDLDIAISLTDTGIEKFIQAVKELQFVPRIPVKLEELANKKLRESWIHQKNMKVFSVYNPKNPMEHIDVIMEEVVDFGTLFKNRVVMGAKDISIPVAGIAELIRLKEHAGRDRDAIDIKALKQIQELKNEKK